MRMAESPGKAPLHRNEERGKRLLQEHCGLPNLEGERRAREEGQNSALKLTHDYMRERGGQGKRGQNSALKLTHDYMDEP